MDLTTSYLGLSPYFSSLGNMARRLTDEGADALVLFNRFCQPDIDLEALEVTPRLALSQSHELRLPLCWDCHVAESFRREHPDLATDRDSRTPAHV